jgi:hypothetical protein
MSQPGGRLRYCPTDRFEILLVQLGIELAIDECEFEQDRRHGHSIEEGQVSSLLRSAVNQPPGTGNPSTHFGS